MKKPKEFEYFLLRIYAVKENVYLHHLIYLDLMANGTIIKSVKDAIAIGSNIIESAETEVIWLVPPSMLIYASSFGLNEKTEMLIKRGGRSRGISNISSTYIEVVRESSVIGEELRHYDQYKGIYFIVADKKESISSINVDPESLSLDDTLVALWTDDPIYAEYLISIFDIAWELAVPASQRLKELFEEDNRTLC